MTCAHFWTAFRISLSANIAVIDHQLPVRKKMSLVEVNYLAGLIYSLHCIEEILDLAIPPAYTFYDIFYQLNVQVFKARHCLFEESCSDTEVERN